MAQLPTMSTVTKIAKPAQYKLQLDMYKLRTSEYRYRYESMRALEWKVLLQVYAGYAAIAIAFFHLTGPGGLNDPKTVAATTMLATVIFYVTTRYVSYRIEERLINFNETYMGYLDAMQNSLEIDKVGPGAHQLRAKYAWLYRSQLILSTLSVAGLLLYQAAVGFPCYLPCAGTLIILVAIVALAIGWFKLPPKPDALCS